MTEDKYPIRDIFQTFYPDYLDSAGYVSPEAQKVANCIMKCKTGELGYTIEVCEKCGHPLIHTASCNNRHCP
ncbi:MAG: transposase zinc-binding domain-containing protein [Candidatus Weimeria sp.]